MNRSRLVLEKPSGQLGGSFRGPNFQCGYGFKGVSFQEGYGFKGVPFQEGSGFKGDRYQEGYGFKGVPFQEGSGFKGDRYQEGYGFKGISFQEGYGGGLQIVGTGHRRFRQQRGAGGWSWLGKLVAKARPLLSKGAKVLGKGAEAVGKHVLSTVTDQALNSGMRVLDGVIDGENVLDTLKHAAREGVQELKETAKMQAKQAGVNAARAGKRKLTEMASSRSQAHQQQQQQQQQQQEGAGGKRRKRQSISRSRDTRGRGCRAVQKFERKKNSYRAISPSW